jgi:beta-aspartyl-peptidase (threonine type)
MGGGGEVDSAVRWFLEKAGGGDIVVLRASGADGYNDYLFAELGVAVDSVETLRFGSRDDGADLEAVETIGKAEAVFLAGGDQSRYLDFWKDQPVGAALNRHLAAGKPIGGTSAGLAVLGEFIYAAHHDGDLTSAIALEDPRHRYLTIETGFLDVPILRGVFTDSHFSERARLGRLMVLLARAQLSTGRQDLLGLGIDEQTALCVEGDGAASVHATGGGRVILVGFPESPRPIPPTGPFGPATAEVVTLGPDSAFSLEDRTVERPVGVVRVRAAKGELRQIHAADRVNPRQPD